MRKQTANAAVREKRAPKIVEADDPLTKLYRALDYYPTPPWAARACAEVVLEIDPDARVVEEPACGEGHMAAPLAEYFPHVHASDIHDFGYGKVIDYLALGRSLFAPTDPNCLVDWTITNPPFMLAEEFLRQALRFSRRGVALLCRLSFLEGENRYYQLHTGEHPLTFHAPFSERVPMHLGRWVPDGSTQTAYSLFVFRKGAIPQSIRPIPPGTRAQLSRPADVLRFAARKPVPLLEKAAA